MARIRTIKPQHVNDKKLAEISLQAHLFWVLSWCFSDDEGVIENDPLLLKSQLFPRRVDIRTDQVKQWIDQLIEARYLIPFTHNGEGYLLQRTFKIHQKIDRPQASKIPPDVIRRTLDEHSTNARPCIVLDSSVEDSKGEEGDKSPPPKRFVKPDKCEVQNYFAEIGLDDFTAAAQTELFYSYYESNGWKVGKNKMQNWKASVSGWKNRMQNFKNEGTKGIIANINAKPGGGKMAALEQW